MFSWPPGSLRGTELADKLSVFVAWMLIMDRNRTRRRPATAVHVWRTLFVGCRTRAGGCRREFDGRTVELHAASRPCFFSPMEVVAKIGFSRGAKRVVLLAAAPIMFRE